MKPALKRMALLGCALVSLLAATGPSAADEDDDHDLARDLHERQEIHALTDIIAVAHARTPGDVVAVDLLNDGNRWLYVIQIVGPDGRRTTLRIDAEAAAILPDSGGDR